MQKQFRKADENVMNIIRAPALVFGSKIDTIALNSLKLLQLIGGKTELMSLGNASKIHNMSNISGNIPRNI